MVRTNYGQAVKSTILYPKKLISPIKYGSQMLELKNSKFQNVFYINHELCTRNLSPGNQVYDETLVTIDKIEYRTWNPRRSKLAALILNGCKFLPITPDTSVLYLGAGNGTTASHVSDIISKKKVYCIEFSARAFRDLLNLATNRKNLFPILENAFYPERYKPLIDKVDVIYQDISQRDQTRIFIINAQQFLKVGGYGILMVKSRSIDITKPPNQIFKEVMNQLEDVGIRIHDQIRLEPFTKDHLGLILSYK